jgi:hypothetical protein
MEKKRAVRVYVYFAHADEVREKDEEEREKIQKNNRKTKIGENLKTSVGKQSSVQA